MGEIFEDVIKPIAKGAGEQSIGGFFNSVVRIFKGDDAEEEEVPEVEEEEETVPEFDPPEEEDPEEVERRERLREQFLRLSGSDKFIDASELQNILNSVFSASFPMDGFSLETTRSMVSLVDNDVSGKLGFYEFQALWQAITKWKNVFVEHDADSTGTMSPEELQAAITEAGIVKRADGADWEPSEEMMNAVVMRFSNSKQAGPVSFDDFLCCIVRLAHCYKIFSEYQREGEDMAEFRDYEYMPTVLFI